MKYFRLRYLSYLTVMWLALPVGAAPAPIEEIYLGSVAMDVPAAMVQRLTPLTAYLSKKTGLKVSFRASPNLGSAVNELGKDFTQIAYLTPVAFIEARDKYRARALGSIWTSPASGNITSPSK